jgi:hypothetical protein
MLDGPGSARIFSLLDDAPVAVARDADARATVADVDTSAPAACPICRAAMLRAPSLGTTVVIDTCIDHGTWFDHGELVLVANAVAAQRGVPLASTTTDPGETSPPSSTWGPVGEVGSAIGQMAGSAVLEGVVSLIAGIFG